MRSTAIAILRYALGSVVFLVYGILLVICTFLPPERLRYRVASHLCRAYIWALGITLKVEGSYPDNAGTIFMANHSSYIDLFVLGAILKGKFTGLAAQEYLWYPFFGTVVKRLGVIPVNRFKHEAAMAAIKVAEERLRSGFHVGILPEGTRSLTGELQPFKSGGFHLALNTGVAIVPIGVQGAFQFKPKPEWRIRPGLITVRIGAAIPSQPYQERGVDALMAEVRSRLLALSGDTHAH